MMLQRHALVLAAILSLPAVAHGAVHPSRSQLQPCKFRGLHGKAPLCGTYQVWENRATKSGRKIGLKIVLFPAASSHPKPDPIFFLAGGPGQAATSLAASAAENPLRRDRDLVFVD